MLNPIRQSVGNGGVNRRQDVETIQELLNQNIKKITPLRPLKVDGRIGPRTIGAIEEFQRRVVGMAHPDGRVDPGKTTFQHLTALPKTSPSPAGAATTINVVRKWETSESTISEFTIPCAGAEELSHGYFLERPGPDTIQSGLRLRIPEGTYRLKWRTTTGLAGVRPHLPVPWLHNAKVSASRYIYIHNGNYPRNTHGCLLVGTTRGKDFVGFSVDALTKLKRYLKRVGIENVRLHITSNYQR